MAYTTRAQIEANLPPQFLLQALDDNGDGTEDTGLLDTILEGADGEVEAILGQRFAVPFTAPIPPVVPRAALVFTLETLYRRRGYGTEERPNPFAAEARKLREKLDRIARGEEPLAPEASRTRPAISAITEASRVGGQCGAIL